MMGGVARRDGMQQVRSVNTASDMHDSMSVCSPFQSCIQGITNSVERKIKSLHE